MTHQWKKRDFKLLIKLYKKGLSYQEITDELNKSFGFYKTKKATVSAYISNQITSGKLRTRKQIKNLLEGKQRLKKLGGKT